MVSDIVAIHQAALRTTTTIFAAGRGDQQSMWRFVPTPWVRSYNYGVPEEFLPIIVTMKDLFKASRSTPDDGTESPWVPPIDLVLDSEHGQHRYVVGRRKWKVAGGHPTLSHGGLSILEVLVPFLDVSRAES